MSKYYGEIVLPQREKKEERIRAAKVKRLHGTVDGWSSTHRLADLLVLLFPGRNEWPGTHCSRVVEEKERNDSFC